MYLVVSSRTFSFGHILLASCIEHDDVGSQEERDKSINSLSHCTVHLFGLDFTPKYKVLFFLVGFVLLGLFLFYLLSSNLDFSRIY